MKIGKLLRSYTIEPLEDPVPIAPPEPVAKTPRAVTKDAIEEQPTRP
jgi:hypothetical protein